MRRHFTNKGQTRRWDSSKAYIPRPSGYYNDMHLTYWKASSIGARSVVLAVKCATCVKVDEGRAPLHISGENGDMRCRSRRFAHCRRSRECFARISILTPLGVKRALAHHPGQPWGGGLGQYVQCIVSSSLTTVSGRSVYLGIPSGGSTISASFRSGYNSSSHLKVVPNPVPVENAGQSARPGLVRLEECQVAQLRDDSMVRGKCRVTLTYAFHMSIQG